MVLLSYNTDESRHKNYPYVLAHKNTTYYSVDPNQRVNLEYDTSDDSVAEIVWGHQSLARKVGNSWYYYIYNAHGDVIGLVNDAGI